MSHPWKGGLLNKAFSVVSLAALTLSFNGLYLAPAASGASLVTDFRQASNNTGAGLGVITWINSIVQQSNSAYYEGMAVPQRLLLTNVPSAGGNIHTLTFNHQFTKGGIHAYDFLTSWAAAEQAATDADTAYEPNLFDQTCTDNIGPPKSLQGTCESLANGTDAGNGGYYHVSIPVPADTFASWAGGSVGTKEAAFASRMGMSAGQARSIDVYANAPISAGSVTLSHSVASGADTGDSDVNYVLTWTSSATQYLIEFAGHLSVSGVASENAEAWTPTTGASQINGGPYHFNVYTLDGASLGSQDNQIKGADILVVPPDVTLTKTADADSVNAGDQIGFTVTLSNSSSAGPARGLTLSDPLPSGTGIDWSIASQSVPAGINCVISGSPPTETLNCGPTGNETGPFTLAAGASITVHVVSVTAYGSCKVYENTVTVTGTNLTASPITAHDSTTVNCPALRVVKTANPAGPVSAGDAIGFDITVYNDGPGTAKSVTLADTLPGTGLTWTLSPAFTGCSITDNVLSCSFGDMASGTSKGPIHVTATTSYAECSVYDNTATASATNAPDASDDASVTCQTPLIHIVKTADASPVNAGTSIGFTLTISNSGPGTAHGVTVTDTLPTNGGLSWVVDGGTAQSTCSITGGVLTCDIGDVASGANATVHIASPTTTATCGVVNNTGNVTTSNDSSDTSSASITVNCPHLGLIAPTQTTCQQYVSGTAPTLDAIQYSVKSGKINQANPGVFFYFSTVDVAAGDTVTITQASPGGSPLFLLNQGHTWVYDMSCNLVGHMSPIGSGATASFTFAAAGTYVLQLQYSTGNVVGYGVSSPYPTFQYDFGTNDNDGNPIIADNASVVLMPK